MHYRGPRKRREREKGPEKIFEEVITKKFSNMGKEIVKSRKHRVLGRINPKRNTRRLSNPTDRN